MTDNALEVQFALTAGQDLYLPTSGNIKTWVNAVLGLLDQSGSICIRIVERPESKALNLKYRGRPRATNVLSFTADIPAGIEGIRRLGDITVCAPIVAEEAREQHKKTADHWAHMIVHGVLHLLGYDHQSHREANVMETLEVKILDSLGIANPYDS